MSFDTCKDVWVFIESFQGQPKSVGLELLGQGRKLADGLKQKLCAIVIGKDVDAAVEGADHNAITRRLGVFRHEARELSASCNNADGFAHNPCPVP